jgi:hypothetical protein
VRTVPLKDAGDGDGRRQVLRWWHAAGEQKLVVKGVRRKRGQVGDEVVGGGDVNDGVGYVETMMKFFGGRGSE